MRIIWKSYIRGKHKLSLYQEAQLQQAQRKLLLSLQCPVQGKLESFTINFKFFFVEEKYGAASEADVSGSTEERDKSDLQFSKSDQNRTTF